MAKRLFIKGHQGKIDTVNQTVTIPFPLPEEFEEIEDTEAVEVEEVEIKAPKLPKKAQNKKPKK